MPTQTTKTKTTVKTKGKGLSKKIGPFPLWSLLAVGILLVLVIVMRRRSANAATATTDNASGFLTPQGNVAPIDNASAGQPSTNSAPSSGLDQSTLDALTSAIGASTPSDYVTSTDLQQQLDQLGNSVGAQIASATLQPLQVTVKTTAATPTSTKTTKAKTVAPGTKTGTKSKAAVKYYTLKKNVPLKKGQTLHFTHGKGYYAA